MECINEHNHVEHSAILYNFFLMCAIPKCLTHIKIYDDVSVKHNKTLLCLLLY